MNERLTHFIELLRELLEAAFFQAGRMVLAYLHARIFSVFLGGRVQRVARLDRWPYKIQQKNILTEGAEEPYLGTGILMVRLSARCGLRPGSFASHTACSTCFKFY